MPKKPSLQERIAAALDERATIDKAVVASNDKLCALCAEAQAEAQKLVDLGMTAGGPAGMAAVVATRAAHGFVVEMNVRSVPPAPPPVADEDRVETDAEALGGGIMHHQV